MKPMKAGSRNKEKTMDAVEYTVVTIWGDYAMLRSDQRVDNQVALALLPEGLEEGQRLLWENFEYRILY